jgi:hypothetical protein
MTEDKETPEDSPPEPPPFEPDPDLIAFAERGAEPGDTKVRIPAEPPAKR